jgi:DNA transformation protein
MFGGIGLYLAGIIFALIGDDLLYFKVDDTNRDDYLAAEMEPFRPFGDSGPTMQYYEVPESVLTDPEELRNWGLKAVEVAIRAKKK